jgi:26S proteasome regulatory subunit N9
MSYLTSTEANALFDEHLVKFPSLENEINKIKTYYLTKMWH